MTVIKQTDFIESISDALQHISFYHPVDFVKALTQAYENEPEGAAREAMAQLLVNSRMCAMDHRPICQDTGIVTVFLDVGMEVSWSGDMSIEEMVNQAVRVAYQHPRNRLRASVVADPAGERINTKDNTPAVIHTRLVKGDRVQVRLMAKGGGSENKVRMTVLNPSDDVVEWIVSTVETLGSGWCPPGVLGVGIGGTPEKAVLLAKESLLAPVDMPEILQKKERSFIEQMRVDLYQKINESGIGAQGLGGGATVLDVKVLDFPTHAASLPVAIVPGCAATRHIHFELDGSGKADFGEPSIEEWPEIQSRADSSVVKVNINDIDPEEFQDWKPGQNLLLTGKILTGRDAAHKRIRDLIMSGKGLPEELDFTGRFIYYVGPVTPVDDEAVGPAGPTTATRMDKFTRFMLENTGLIGMIGKAERGAEAIQAIRDNKAVYLIGVGGAAYLISKSVKASRIVAFEDLGMEAVYEFDVVDMPVTVAVDVNGESIHTIGPENWKKSRQNQLD